MKSRCFLLIFIILVFILDFRLVRKLVFLYFNVNVYLKEIPCLNKVTLPYLTNLTLISISRTLDFSKHPITQTNFGSRGTKLTLNNSNLQKFRNHLVWTSITFMPLNKLTIPDKLFSCILITQQATNPSVISLKGTMTVFCYVLFLFFKYSMFCL